MNREKLIELLKAKAEPDYAAFTKKLAPTTGYVVLGVRVPQIKALAKTLTPEEADMLESEYYEEVMLHGLAVALQKRPLAEKLSRLEAILPQIDNWAICDSTAMALTPKAAEREALYEWAMALAREPQRREYFVRFGVITLSSKFIDEAHIDAILKLLGTLQSELYYINMALAWAICDSFIRFPKRTRVLMESGAISADVLKKAKQKLRDSRRVSEADKLWLRGN